MKVILANVSYGNGPFLRGTETALAVASALEKRRQARPGVLVPWIYGDRQLSLMREAFETHRQTIFLDEELGRIFSRVFFGSGTFQTFLDRWIGHRSAAERDVQKRLRSKMKVIDLDGREKSIEADDVEMEIARAPLLRSGIEPSFHVGFGLRSEILEAALDTPTAFALEPATLRPAIEAALEIEGAAALHAVSDPGTFSYRKNRPARFDRQIDIPPTIDPLRPPGTDQIEKGVYVTVSGIPGLDRLYRDITGLGMRIYANETRGVPGAVRAHPNALLNPNILLHFARSGWGAVWTSLIAGTPLVVLPFDPNDDPEIYFNNICVEELGLGRVYRGESWDRLAKEAPAMREKLGEVRRKLSEKFGTLDGNGYVAERIAEAFLSGTWQN